MIPPNAHDSGPNSDGSPLATAPTESHPGALVPVRPGAVAGVSQDWAEIGSTWGGESSSEGFNVLDFLYGLRRRWLLTLALCVSLGPLAVGLCLWLVPANYKATAVIRINKEALRGGRRMTSKDFLIYKQTQAQILMSSPVIDAVLRAKEISGVRTLQQEPDMHRFLTEEISVVSENESELIFVSLAGDRPEDLRKIVDAVQSAYILQVVDKERLNRQERLSLRRDKLLEIEGNLQKNRESLRGLSGELGTTDAKGAQFKLEVLRSELARLSKRSSLMENKVEEAQLQWHFANERYKILITKGLGPLELMRLLRDDLSYQVANQELAQAKGAFDRIQQQTRANSSRRRQAALAVQQAEQRLNRIESEFQRKMREKMKNGPGRQEVRLLFESLNFLRRSKDKLGKELAKQKEKLAVITNLATEYFSVEDKVIELASSRIELAQEVFMLDIEAQEHAERPPILLIQPAHIPQTSKVLPKVMISGMSGLMVVGLVIMGVGLLEYLRKRISTVNEVSQRMGLSLVGTLPSLSGHAVSGMARRGMSLEEVLTDSIDSIRAALVHGANSGAHRVIMVSSATHGEGKSTVASQLAASLARCGQKTLLIDANLRNPALHLLFDRPMEYGLSEVLRGEVDVQDVIRPTEAEGLWMMGAGYSDYTSIQSLENNNLTQLFGRLNTEFDFIIVDTAPVLSYADAMLIGQHVDGAILSVRLDVSERPKVQEAFNRLRSVGVWMFGAVVNGAKTEANRRTITLQQAAETPQEAVEA